VPRILAVDYGEKRVGLAISDPSGEIALSLRTVEVRGEADVIAGIRQAIADTDADRIVVGLPVNMNGTLGPMAAKVTAFSERLAAATGLPVETSDERLSTSAAERSLLEGDLSRQKRRGLRDKVAAQIILQGYLDAHGAGNLGQ
jgi:putative holliday junction resolvase